jgi:hypothetical protein
MHRVNDSFRGHERHNQVNNRGNDWHCDYTDAAEDEDCTTSPVDECELYPLPSEVPHWANNDNIVWHHDGFHPDEDALFYDETPRHERHLRNGTLHARVQRYDIKLQQHRMNLSKRDRDSFLKRSSKVMGGDHCRQTVLRCRKSVDMITWEGKVKLGKLWLRTCIAVLFYPYELLNICWALMLSHSISIVPLPSCSYILFFSIFTFFIFILLIVKIVVMSDDDLKFSIL